MRSTVHIVVLTVYSKEVALVMYNSGSVHSIEMNILILLCVSHSIHSAEGF